jgi:hypothetical protein
VEAWVQRPSLKTCRTSKLYSPHPPRTMAPGERRYKIFCPVINLNLRRKI